MLPSVSVPAPESRTLAAPEEPFSFHGSAAEYFRIWIVNLALTLATLGIYSAWAKVRTQRYFYANTWLAGAPFEYLAGPLPILRGRLIAASALAAYVLSARFLPTIEPLLLFALSVATPWVVVRSLAFRAHSSAWRGLRLRFSGDMVEAYVNFLLLYLAVFLSFGLLYPWVQWRQRSFVVEGHRFADREVRLHAGPGPFYRIWIVSALLAGFVSVGAFTLLLAPAVLTVVTVFDLPTEELVEEDAEPGDAGAPEADAEEASDAADLGWIDAWLLLWLLPLYAGYSLVMVFAQARVTNLVWNATHLGPHQFRSTLRARVMIWLYLSNTVAILASAGLLIPWARIRMARYRAEHLTLLPGGDLDRFVAHGAREPSAAGSELGDFFGVDLGF